MGMEKEIEHKKEHRKPYRGAKAVERTCRNHGGCKWCKGNRMYKHDKKKLRAKQELEEYGLNNMGKGGVEQIV